MKSPVIATFAFAALACLSARAADLPPLSGVLTLSASAAAEVTADVLSVALVVTREGADAQAVQGALKQALEATLEPARKSARPDGRLDVHSGNFSLSPRYSNKGQVSGWQGSAELLVEGTDMTAIAQLTGRLNALAAGPTVARVGYRLSRAAREKVEGEVAAQAIERFRARAGEYARQFGYGGYTLREVNVTGSEPFAPGPVPMLRTRAMAAGADEALPVEPGKASVTVTVGGSVQMK